MASLRVGAKRWSEVSRADGFVVIEKDLGPVRER
jgi:hypothetical protein